MRRMSKHDLDLIIGLHPMVGLHGYSIDKYIAVLSRLLYLIAGGILHEVHQKLIHS